MWFPALLVLLSMAPVWASMERILGRSLPKLRYSPAVKRNRVYVAVPVVMGAVWMMGVVWLVAAGQLRGARDAGWVVWIAMFGLGVAALAGWVVYTLLACGEVAVSAARWAARHFR